MSGLSEQQMTVIRTLIDSAPDAAVRNLDKALTAGATGGAMIQIRDMVRAEAADRKTRDLVFQPFLALCPKTAPTDGRQSFPHKTVPMLWRALKTYAPEACAAAESSTRLWTLDADPAPVFDSLCADAAQGLRYAAGSPFAPVAVMLAEAEPNGAEAFASYLDLAPLARDALQKLPDWLARMNDDKAVIIRLAFRDATAIGPDGGPKFLELLSAQLAEPAQILRIVSAVMDRPADSYLASSELAFLGERFLAQIEQCVAVFNAFDPWAGIAAGRKAAEAVTVAVNLIHEFEQEMDLSKEGPWGKVILRHKQMLAQSVEKVLGKADDAVAAALPLKMARYGKGRGMPRYDQPPEARQVSRAQGMLAFLNGCRGAAPAGGYASYRAKIVEKLDDRIDHYVEDVLDHLRDEEATDKARAGEFLEVAANLVGLFRDEKAAQIVRRRAAA